MDVISYYFILIAYIIFICTPYFSDGRLNNTVQKLPAYSCSLIYLLIQIITAIIVAQADITFNKTYVLVQTILTGIYLLILFSIFYVNENTSKKQQLQELNIKFLDELEHLYNNLCAEVTNKLVKENLENLVDSVRISPVKTERDTTDIENEIWDKSELLENAVKSNKDSDTIIELCTEIKVLLRKRNKI